MPDRKSGRERPSRKAEGGQEPSKAGAACVRWLHFVRHGEYVQEGDFGAPGGPLTPLGRSASRAI